MLSFSKLLQRCSRSRQRVWSASWSITVCLLLTTVTVRAQEPRVEDTISVETNLISVPVIVSDRNNRYVPDLRIGAFKLFDNDVQQKISYFDTGEEPLNVVLMLDTSLSTSGVLDDIKKAAKEFLKELRPQDRAMIVTFDWQVEKLSALTTDRKELESAIKHTKVGKYAGTLFNDALMEISSQVLQPIRGRKAIVLLSDGEDHGSQTMETELIAAESEADAMIYSIYYQSEFLRHFGNGPQGRPGRGRFPGPGRRPFHHVTPQRPGGGPGRGGRRGGGVNGAELMEQLSTITGGRFYNGDTKHLKETFALIAEELRHQYRLGFYPGELKHDGTVHALNVKVDLADVSVRSRREYRAK
jgi:VWFA-related protein